MLATSQLQTSDRLPAETSKSEGILSYMYMNMSYVRGSSKIVAQICYDRNRAKSKSLQ